MHKWALKRQLIAALILSLPVIVIALLLIYFIYPSSSCVDGKKNGNEAEVDCGGECRPCLGRTDPPVIIWARPFLVRQGVYDAAALVENPNFQAGSRDVRYTFKLYDENGVLLASRSGGEYLYPSERIFVYEPVMPTGSKRAVKAEFRIDSIKWERLEAPTPPEIDVIKKDYIGDPHPIVTVRLANRGLIREQKLEVFVLLERKDGNAYAVSKTVIENLESSASRDLLFTWPTSSFEDPSNINILYRRVLE